MSGPLDGLIPAPAPEAASYRLGTITSASPWRVRLDGDTASVASSPIVLTRPAVGARVLVLLHHRRMYVLGEVGGGPQDTDGYTVIGGTAYRSSGAWPTFQIPAWARSQDPVYTTTHTLPRPYAPPAGWGFAAHLLTSSGFTGVSTSNPGDAATSVAIRIWQFFSAAQVDITVGWRLVRTTAA